MHKADRLFSFLFFLNALSLFIPHDFMCLGCSRYPVQCDSQSLGDNSIIATHHPLCCAPCSLLERTHISRS